ncbi:MAG: hypothetical protein JNM98_19815 [Rhodocyclaceae bacterium]|nr:hypothetical protein [Rhodocyclaceae bacterium]
MRRLRSDSGIALTLRRLRARFGFSARPRAVRAHWPWPLRLAAGFAAVAVVFALAWWLRPVLTPAAVGAAADESSALRARLAQLERELADLREGKAQPDSAVAIERSAREQLASQLKAAQDDNARLKEDLAMYEELASAGRRNDAALTITRLKVEAGALDGHYRYRMLVAAPAAGGRDPPFSGSYQLLVSLLHEGRNVIMQVPAGAEPDRSNYTLNFKHFKRVDGEFAVPAGARPTSVEARVLQGGQIRAKTSVKF